MGDLKKYVEKRRKTDNSFDEGYDAGYETFKIGVLFKQAREEAGLTQQQIADKLHTKKSTVSRMENHAEDIRLSTLNKFALALGKRMEVAIH
jgi:HTH-type transcriptional regulator / antitoxin HipB